MPVMVEIDDHTFRYLEFAARMSNTTSGAVIARLVQEASMPAPAVQAGEEPSSQRQLAIYADYDGHRTHATYDPDTTRIDITSGPLMGRSFKSPTGAARAVVGHHKPEVSPNRNGWSFWVLNNGTGHFLQTVRPPGLTRDAYVPLHPREHSQ